jgi:hypothetical protein|tara:strand:+ start:1594 stop:1734 length:141 start_codon:yes stop_codon:yes gene_type:complete
MGRPLALNDYTAQVHWRAVTDNIPPVDIGLDDIGNMAALVEVFPIL